MGRVWRIRSRVGRIPANRRRRAPPLRPLAPARPHRKPEPAPGPRVDTAGAQPRRRFSWMSGGGAGRGCSHRRGMPASSQAQSGPIPPHDPRSGFLANTTPTVMPSMSAPTMPTVMRIVITAGVYAPRTRVSPWFRRTWRPLRARARSGTRPGSRAPPRPSPPPAPARSAQSPTRQRRRRVRG